MTKPHEQIWTYCEASKCVTNEAGYDVTAYDADEEEMRLIAAAPAMARALLDLHAAISAGVLNVDDAPEFIERVLKEAGVMP